MRRNHILVVGAATVFLLGGAGLAGASIPGPDGVIKSCYTASSGAIKIIDSEATCKSGSTVLTWNQEGPQGEVGPAGPPGADGATGETGPAGPSGFSGYEIVAESQQAGSPTSRYADCPDGKVVVGGGFNGPNPDSIYRSYPSGSRTWVVAAQTTTTFTVYAICVTAPSSPAPS